MDDFTFSHSPNYLLVFSSAQRSDKIKLHCARPELHVSGHVKSAIYLWVIILDIVLPKSMRCRFQAKGCVAREKAL